MEILLAEGEGLGHKSTSLRRGGRDSKLTVSVHLVDFSTRFAPKKCSQGLRIPHARLPDVLPSSRTTFAADGEGFEPSIRFNPYNGLAIHLFRPLRHPSSLDTISSRSGLVE